MTQLDQEAGGVESCRFRIREPGSLLAIKVLYADRDFPFRKVVESSLRQKGINPQVLSHFFASSDDDGDDVSRSSGGDG